MILECFDFRTARGEKMAQAGQGVYDARCTRAKTAATLPITTGLRATMVDDVRLFLGI